MTIISRLATAPSVLMTALGWLATAPGTLAMVISRSMMAAGPVLTAEGIRTDTIKNLRTAAQLLAVRRFLFSITGMVPAIKSGLM